MKLEPADLPPHVLYKWRHTVYPELTEDIPIFILKKGEELPIAAPDLGTTRLVAVWRLVKDE